MEVLEPTKEFTFEINGGAVATDATPEWSEDRVAEISGEESTDAEAKVTASANISIQDESKILNVSGACDDPYFVVLIYKDAEGYNTNPSSYIYNRAYPCENKQYSYDLSNLPFSLESGTFYLLIASQGDKGPWRPISAMTPIGIIVKTIIPEAEETPNEPEP
jgi:hypothetical protein